MTSKPPTSEPLSTEPPTSEPLSTEPPTSEPLSTEPLTSEPLSTEPITSKPLSTDPITTEPLSTESLTSPRLHQNSPKSAMSPFDIQILLPHFHIHITPLIHSSPVLIPSPHASFLLTSSLLMHPPHEHSSPSCTSYRLLHPLHLLHSPLTHDTQHRAACRFLYTRDRTPKTRRWPVRTCEPWNCVQGSEGPRTLRPETSGLLELRPKTRRCREVRLRTRWLRELLPRTRRLRELRLRSRGLRELRPKSQVSRLLRCRTNETREQPQTRGHKICSLGPVGRKNCSWNPGVAGTALQDPTRTQTILKFIALSPKFRRAVPRDIESDIAFHRTMNPSFKVRVHCKVPSALASPQLLAKLEATLPSLRRLKFARKFPYRAAIN
ncbi:hypothetical protein HAZT_HAZT003451 [Hyalella azteca]|uniref:Uncharacterized protein n=1 Tax=Hyalella azteca TaxID=294128 RepID=A0A6A0HEY1_HYAAZ|nr:hypothetical protein HAZT_HAZT003451 [Hyalella azteca]